MGCSSNHRLSAILDNVDAGPSLDARERALDAVEPVDLALDAPANDLGVDVPWTDDGFDVAPVSVGIDMAATDVGVDAQPAVVRVDAQAVDGAIDTQPDGPGVTIVASLPSRRHSAIVFSDGKVVYALGGSDDAGKPMGEVVRFDPATNTVKVLPETLPQPLYAASVAWTGSAAYIFGGLVSSAADTRQILRYEPSKGTFTQMKAKLPSGAYAMGAAWTGSTVYLLGGSSYEPALRNLNQVLSYDVAADSLATLPAVLTMMVDGPTALWDGTSALAIGGDSGGVPTVAIERLEPASGQVTLAGTLDAPLWAPVALYDGSRLLLVGGIKQLAPIQVGYRTILSFDPKTYKTTTLPLTLPFNVSGSIGAWVSSVSAGYLMGGVDYDAAKALDTIIRIKP
jgi:hypothetical protein